MTIFIYFFLFAFVFFVFKNRVRYRCADLLNASLGKDENDFKNSVTFNNPAAGQLSVTSTAYLVGDKVNGKSTVNFTDKKYGTQSLEIQDNQDMKYTAKICGGSIQKGLNFGAECKKTSKVDCKGNAQFSQDGVNVNVELVNAAGSEKAAASKTIIAQASAGYEGVSVGAQLTKVLGADGQDLLFGAQYAQNDLTVSGVTNKDKGLTLGAFQKVSSSFSHGFQYSTGSKDEKSLDKFNLGASYVFDSNTNGKVNLNIPRADASGFSVSALLSHKLANPNASLDMKYNFTPLTKASKFALGVTFNN